MSVSTLQAQVSKAATFNGTGLDISAFTRNAVIRVKVDSLTAAKGVVFAIQDSVDGFSSDTRTLWTFNVVGAITTIAPREVEIHEYTIPSVRYGVSSATLRLAVLSIDGSTTVIYEAFVQQ